MALYAFDGTGNEDQDCDETDSNVINFFHAYIDPRKNVDPDEKEGSLFRWSVPRTTSTRPT